ncbi:hypothetical protein Pyn_03683 [Prunus yedoensis var. nudiflora]|uniref:Uncharacterized protein n=1 Tax=Prunus yedoensis var. nudiflora TaxID=2094558 RepID=A0A314XMU8_PRUYE|nr:hypothetical protein Pyn_03683 [Prunus yedoensis var. nudiflora]
MWLFAFVDTILYFLGCTDSIFAITAKVADEDVSQQYEKEIMEFGASSPMLTILATVAFFNLYCFAAFVKEATTGSKGIAQIYETMALQILLWGSDPHQHTFVPSTLSKEGQGKDAGLHSI